MSSTDKIQRPHKHLYRLLRADEGNAKCTGIRAKNPTGNVTIQQHVSYGSSGMSQYISTSASKKAIRKFAQLTTTTPAMVAVINCQHLEGVVYIDLTKDVVRRKHLCSERAVSLATKFEEVLIIGYIPSYCIESVVEI